MKEVLFFISFISFTMTSGNSFGQWNIIFSVPDTNYNLVKTQFIDDNIGFVLGVNSINNTSCIYKLVLFINIIGVFLCKQFEVSGGFCVVSILAIFFYINLTLIQFINPKQKPMKQDPNISG